MAFTLNSSNWLAATAEPAQRQVSLGGREVSVRARYVEGDKPRADDARERHALGPLAVVVDNVANRLLEQPHDAARAPRGHKSLRFMYSRGPRAA